MIYIGRTERRLFILRSIESKPDDGASSVSAAAVGCTDEGLTEGDADNGEESAGSEETEEGWLDDSTVSTSGFVSAGPIRRRSRSTSASCFAGFTTDAP